MIKYSIPSWEHFLIHIMNDFHHFFNFQFLFDLQLINILTRQNDSFNHSLDNVNISYLAYNVHAKG